MAPSTQIIATFHTLWRREAALREDLDGALARAHTATRDRDRLKRVSASLKTQVQNMDKVRCQCSPKSGCATSPGVPLPL